VISRFPFLRLVATVLILSLLPKIVSALEPDDKLIILVDKVLMKDTRPDMTVEQMTEIRDAGFNVVSPRWGGDDLEIMRRLAERAHELGLGFVPWFRCTGYTEDDDRKMVWRDGTVQKKLYSPNDNEFWEKFSDVILGHARISADIPSVLGAFLDFENYDKVGSRGQCYSLSYDEKILGEFASAEGTRIPELAPGERYPWLVAQGLHDKFSAFQIRSWRQRCRELRQKIDRINPRFRLIIYPAPGTLFIKEAVYPEWGTKAAPLILADASVYARSLPFVRERPSLEGNRRKILDHIAFVKRHVIPFTYLGGLDPILEMDNPEFVGKNAEMLAQATDGYWVFYEGPTYGQEDHRDFFNAFRNANDSIHAKRYTHHKEPRKTPESLGPERLERGNTRPMILHDGINIAFHKQLKTHRGPSGNAAYDVRFQESMHPAYLSNASALILQGSTRWRPADEETRRTLRRFVRKGGGILITHLGWTRRGCVHPDTVDGDIVVDIHDPAARSLFPEIASWTKTDNEASDGWRVHHQRLRVVEDHAAIAPLRRGDSFDTDSPNHMVLQPGPTGTVIARNAFDDPVCIAGAYGRGRVVFSGCTYGYTSSTHPINASGLDRESFYSFLRWLVDGQKQASTRPPESPGNEKSSDAVAEVLSGKRNVANAAWWGFDATDATDALQAAIDSGAKKVIVPCMNADWIVRPIDLASNQEVNLAPGVVITAKEGEYKGRDDSVFSIDSKTNVTLRGYGAEVRMHKADYMNPEIYEKAEWRMTLRCRGSSEIKILGLTLRDSGGDGIYVGAKGNQSFCRDVLIRDVVCDNHLRQGMSIIGAVNLLVENCVFKNTGGTPPAAGIDFEPNGEGYHLKNCVIRNCVLENNQGSKMAASGIHFWLGHMTRKSDDISIRVENCHVNGGENYGILIGPIHEGGPGGSIEFKNCTIENTDNAGLILRDRPDGSFRIRFDNCTWRNVTRAKEPKDLHCPISSISDGTPIPAGQGATEFVSCYLYGRKDQPFLVPVELERSWGVRRKQ